MLSNEERKAIERIEDFLTTNIIVSISSDETANSEELKVFISKNEYLSIEFIATSFLKQSKKIEELKDTKKELTERVLRLESDKFWDNVVSKDKIKAKIEVLEKLQKEFPNNDEIRIKIIAYKELLEKE